MFMADKHTPAAARVNRPTGYDFRPVRHVSFGEFPACGATPRIGFITDDRGNAMNTSLAKLLPLLLAVLMLSACGGGGGSGPVSSLALFTGDMAGVGNVDGAGAAARFNFPRGVATDNAGNVYVADAGNHTIRK